MHFFIVMITGFDMVLPLSLDGETVPKVFEISGPGSINGQCQTLRMQPYLATMMS